MRWLGKSVGIKGPSEHKSHFLPRWRLGECSEALHGMKSFCLLPSRSWRHLPQWEDHCAWSKHWNVAPWAGARPFGCHLHEVPAPESYWVKGDSGTSRARPPGGEECGGRCIWSSKRGACSCENYQGGNWDSKGAMWLLRP